MDNADKESIFELILGVRVPANGMEKHFLRAVKGYASPCTPIEKEWYQWWKLHNAIPQGSPKTSVLVSPAAIYAELKVDRPPVVDADIMRHQTELAVLVKALDPPDKKLKNKKQPSKLKGADNQKPKLSDIDVNSEADSISKCNA